MSETYRFTLGAFNCIVINDGYIDNIPASSFFEGAALGELQAAFVQYNITGPNLRIPTAVLFIDTGAHRVLIDTGGGPDTLPATGHLLAGLRAEGISPESIDVVALSHGHWDHIGGNTDAHGQPAFPKARYVMARAEYDHWITLADLARFPIIARNLNGIRAALDLIEADAVIVPGIQALPTPGHTAHHTSFVVTSQGETLYCLMDTVDHPLHFEHIDWTPDWDELPLESAESRRILFERASREQARVHGFHLPFPGLGRLTEDRPDTWRYEPVGK